MSTTIKLTKGTLGGWTCELELDDYNGLTFTQKIGQDLSFEREELIVEALDKLGIEVKYFVDGKEIK